MDRISAIFHKFQQYPHRLWKLNGYYAKTRCWRQIWPVRLGIESNAFHVWNNCPYIPYDFDDHFKEINVPVLTFRTELYGVATYGNILMEWQQMISRKSHYPNMVILTPMLAHTPLKILANQHTNG